MRLQLIGTILGLCLAPSLASAEGKSIIVLDGSGSMWGQIDGRPKLEIAREALAQVLSGLPEDTQIGLMAYGHRTKGDCGDIELIVAPAAGTGPAIIAAANAMNFLGKTPLSDAVKMAAAELRSTEEKATVILITDGIETCNADPCALGAELEASGVDFTAHVVGFGLSEEEGKAVACLAENTGGKYIEASDTSTLVDAIETAVAEPPPAPEPAVLENNVKLTLRLIAEGPEVDGALVSDATFEFWTVGADGMPGESVQSITGQLDGQIPEGAYILRTTLHSAVVDQPIDVSATDLVTPEVILDAGILSIRILSEEGGAPDANGYWEVNGAGGVSDGGYAEALRVLPSGEYELVAKLGEMSTKESIDITAGETLEKTIIMGIGIPVFTAYYAEGVPVEGKQSFEILEAKVGLDGKREGVSTIYNAGATLKLPPGDYAVIANVGSASAEMAFTVKPGQRSDVAVILNAGIAAITAPNAKSMVVFEASVGLDGKRNDIRTDYGDSFLLTLPAGDYIAAVVVDQASAEAPFTVKPAERTELTIAIPAGMAAVASAGADAIEIFEAKVGLDGSRKQVSNDYGESVARMLPPGDYVATARAGRATAETAFTVKDAERSDVTVEVAFGIATISAPSARAIAIYPAEVGLDGKRKGYLSYDYGEKTAQTLPPGDYIAEAEYEDKTMVETAFTLSDKQRAEVVLTKP